MVVCGNDFYLASEESLLLSDNENVYISGNNIFGNRIGILVLESRIKLNQNNLFFNKKTAILSLNPKSQAIKIVYESSALPSPKAPAKLASRFVSWVKSVFRLKPKRGGNREYPKQTEKDSKKLKENHTPNKVKRFRLEKEEKRIIEFNRNACVFNNTVLVTLSKEEAANFSDSFQSTNLVSCNVCWNNHNKIIHKKQLWSKSAVTAEEGAVCGEKLEKIIRNFAQIPKNFLLNREYISKLERDITSVVAKAKPNPKNLSVPRQSGWRSRHRTHPERKNPAARSNLYTFWDFKKARPKPSLENLEETHNSFILDNMLHRISSLQLLKDDFQNTVKLDQHSNHPPRNFFGTYDTNVLSTPRKSKCEDGQEHLNRRFFEFMYNANGSKCNFKGDQNLTFLRTFVNKNTARNPFNKHILDLHLLYHSCQIFEK